MDIRQAVDFLASALGFDQDDTVMTQFRGAVQYSRLAQPSKFFGDIVVHPGGTQVRSIKFISHDSLKLYTKQGVVFLDLKHPGSLGHLRDFFEKGWVTLVDYEV